MASNSCYQGIGGSCAPPPSPTTTLVPGSGAKRSTQPSQPRSTNSRISEYAAAGSIDRERPTMRHGQYSGAQVLSALSLYDIYIVWARPERTES